MGGVLDCSGCFDCFGDCAEDTDVMRHYVPLDKRLTEGTLQPEKVDTRDQDVNEGGAFIMEVESKEEEPYLDIGTDGEEEFVISLDQPGEDLFTEFVAPSDMPPLFNDEVTVPSDLPKLFNNEIKEQGNQADDIGPPKTEEDVEFLIKSVQYSRLMNAISNESKLRDVVKTMQRLKVQDGDVVIQQGDTENVQSYYVLESGAVDVFVFDQFRVTIQPGWCFGELSFVFGAPRSASCVASADSVLWVLSREPFDRILAGLSPLESLKIVRQASDPGDEFDIDDAELSKAALIQIYGADFFEDNTTVRDITAGFMTELAAADYIGVPDEVRRAMAVFATTGKNIRYDSKSHCIVEAEGT